jgi:hypothetical protein
MAARQPLNQVEVPVMKKLPEGAFDKKAMLAWFVAHQGEVVRFYVTAPKRDMDKHYLVTLQTTAKTHIKDGTICSLNSLGDPVCTNDEMVSLDLNYYNVWHFYTNYWHAYAETLRIREKQNDKYLGPQF